jgi:aspartate aminotransferase-like enzyme
MPGPVNLHPDVKEIYYSTFMSHRSAGFYTDVTLFSANLCRYVNAQNVSFFVGSGSLANEVVAQYLKQLPGKGLILVNGEFGKRIKEQAMHIQLPFDAFDEELGRPFNYTLLENELASNHYTWLWFVHCETSSGVLNKMETLKNLGNKYKVKIAVDCISSIGNTPVNLEGIYLASGTSGKGLASYPGIAMVYHQDGVTDLNTVAIPRYMDLKHHQETNQVPYTISTNLFYALVNAFNGVNSPAHFQQVKQLSDFLYEELSALGFTFLGNYADMMPGVISIVCPPEINSYDLGVELEKNNFFVNYGGSYLRKVNYFQVCIMGHQEKKNVEKLVEFLKAIKEKILLKTAS